MKQINYHSVVGPTEVKVTYGKNPDVPRDGQVTKYRHDRRDAYEACTTRAQHAAATGRPGW